MDVVFKLVIPSPQPSTVTVFGTVALAEVTGLLPSPQPSAVKVLSCVCLAEVTALSPALISQALLQKYGFNF